MKVTTHRGAQEKTDIRPRTSALASTMSPYSSSSINSNHGRLQQEVSVLSEGLKCGGRVGGRGVERG